MRALQQSLSHFYRFCWRHVCRDDLISDCRRLQRELDSTTEGLSATQRAQRSAAAGAAELEVEVERLTGAKVALEAELQAAGARAQRLQVRQVSRACTGSLGAHKLL